jgi:hypothetical protein
VIAEQRRHGSDQLWRRLLERISGIRPTTLRIAMATPTTSTPTISPFKPGLCMKAAATSR